MTSSNGSASEKALQLLSRQLPVRSVPDLDETDRRHLRRQVRCVAAWHRASGVTGFGLGPKFTNGAPTESLACRVYVFRKRPLAALGTRERIPAQMTLPGLADEVVLDVIELPPPGTVALTDPMRPVFPGLSAGHCRAGQTGSIGAFVARPEDPGAVYMLGACHVLAFCGLGRRGDAIIQPSVAHGGSCPAYTIAELADYVPFSLEPNFPNVADLALARLQPGVGVEAGFDRCNRFARPDELAPGYTMLLRTGCQSGRAAALLSETRFATWIPHWARHGGKQYFGFRDQLLYTSNSLEGDSGGPVMTADGALVGIHIAQAGAFGVATPVWAIPSQWTLNVFGDQP